MKELTMKLTQLFPGTAANEDPAQGALCVEVQDTEARRQAYVQFGCAPGVSTDKYPIFAFCVKLGRADMQFQASWWRTDAYAEAIAKVPYDKQSYWSTFPRLVVNYEPTTDWQLVILDGSRFENPNFNGNWSEIGLMLLANGKTQVGDRLWLKWAGAFANVEAAKAYFSAGVVFEDPTALFWHAESAPVVEKPQFPVIPALSAEESAKRITNLGAKDMGKLPSERVLVAPYDKNFTFCHHAGMAFFKGKMYVSWSSHEKDEDAAGQHVRVAYSDDYYHWSEPQVVGKTRQAQFGETGLLCSHMYATDEALYLYCAEKQFSASAFDKDGKFTYKNYDENLGGGTVIAIRMLRYTTTDGVNWNDGEEVDIQHWTNESPRQSLTGRLFAGAGPELAWTDDPRGFDLVKLGRPNAEQIQDAIRRGVWFLTEASWFQTDDLILHMFMRSNAGYLWTSESYDNGVTWSDIYPTRFVGDNTMPNFGRLPDGRYYFVGDPYWNNARFPLALCVSEDGMNFDKMYTIRDEVYQIQTVGQAKDFQYAYPEVRLDDEYMYIAYSKGKEVMEVTRIKLSDIK